MCIILYTPYTIIYHLIPGRIMSLPITPRLLSSSLPAAAVPDFNPAASAEINWGDWRCQMESPNTPYMRICVLPLTGKSDLYWFPYNIIIIIISTHSPICDFATLQFINDAHTLLIATNAEFSHENFFIRWCFFSRR